MYLLGISDKPHFSLLSLKSLGLLRFVSHHTRSYPPPSRLFYALLDLLYESV